VRGRSQCCGTAYLPIDWGILPYSSSS
jgi:hypothetical protein